MIVSVLLGKSQPQAALSSAAQQVNQILARADGGGFRHPARRSAPAGRPPGGPGRAAAARRRVMASEQFTGWAFVTPGVAIILLFGAVPIVWSAVMSFQKSQPAHAEHAVRRPEELPAAGARPDRRRRPSSTRWSTPRCSCPGR